MYLSAFTVVLVEDAIVHRTALRLPYLSLSWSGVNQFDANGCSGHRAESGVSEFL